MVTIADLARELDAQPHEIAAFADLGYTACDVELDADTEAMIREAWAIAEAESRVDRLERAEDQLLEHLAAEVTQIGQELAYEERLVMDDLADIARDAGYDDRVMRRLYDE